MQTYSETESHYNSKGTLVVFFVLWELVVVDCDLERDKEHGVNHDIGTQKYDTHNNHQRLKFNKCSQKLKKLC